jgi:hypothetical protein
LSEAPNHQPLRKSVPTATVEAWWAVGWAYVMPDFDTPNNSLIEWLSDKPPREPFVESQNARTLELDRSKYEWRDTGGEGLT